MPSQEDTEEDAPIEVQLHDGPVEEQRDEVRHMLHGCGVAALDPLSSEFSSTPKRMHGGFKHLVLNISKPCRATIFSQFILAA